MNALLRLWGPRLLVLVLLGAAAAWIVDRTEWVEQPVADPQARREPFDATASTRGFLARLGLSTRRVQSLDLLPPPGATLVLTAEHWRLLPQVRPWLLAWVEAGGHLVGDATLVWGDDEGAWLGVTRSPRRGTGGECRVLSQPESLPPAWGDPRGFVVCTSISATLEPAAAPTWTLHSEAIGTEVLRYPRGRGRITLHAGVLGFGMPVDADTNAELLPWAGLAGRSLWRGDQAAWIAALVDARPGAEVWFLDRIDVEPMPVWLARQAGAALLLAAVALAGWLWLRGTRLGPRRAEAPPRRRALADQIAGSAAFLQQNDPRALLAAARRALDDAARARIPGWARLAAPAAAATLARHTGLPAGALADALAGDRPPNRHDTDIACLERARRALILTPDRNPRRP